MITETVDVTDNPFPGLRPFQFAESRLFFGREGLSEDLLEKLGDARFLAVIGSSGSGKSSLVRAGLLPALVGGNMDVGSDWRVAVMRPGNGPISELVRALNRPDVLGSKINDNEEAQSVIIEETLRRGSTGLVEIVRQAGLFVEDQINLLIVVDQFEELFRFGSDSSRTQLRGALVSKTEPKATGELEISNNGRGWGTSEAEKYENEATAFIKLLLEATQQTKISIFVVITMRSDYFANCAEFRGLPEAINKGQYLIPRLTREQTRLAITGPIKMFGAEITPRLVTQLLNDMGDDSDHLPLLQHALMRTWKEARTGSSGIKLLDLDHYEAMGGMAGALSKHAEAAYNSLSEKQRVLAEKLFKCLTVKGTEGQEIRRPTILSDLCKIIDEKEEEIIEVIEVFRRRGRSFLMPPAGEALKSASRIDISHESLIPCWHRLSKWVEEESEAARWYRRLADSAMWHKEKRAELLPGAEADFMVEWYDNANPNEAWAKRYHDADFQTVMNFLDESEQLRKRQLEAEQTALRKEAWEKFLRILRPTLTIGAAFLLVVSIIAVWKGWEAERNKQEAVKRGDAAERRGYAGQIAVAQARFDQGNYATANASLEGLQSFIESTLARNLDDFAGFEWYYLWRLTHKEKETLGAQSKSPNYSVAFSPHNGQRIAVGTSNGFVRIWDKAGDKWTSRELEVSKVAIRSLAFSPTDKRSLATQSADGSVRLCDMDSGQMTVLQQAANRKKMSVAVAFSPDGKLLAAVGTAGGKNWGTVSLWEMSSTPPRKLEPIQVQNADEPIQIQNADEPFVVSSIAFSSGDGKILAIGTDGRVRIFDRITGEHPNNQNFKARTADKELIILDPTTGAKISVLSLAFSPTNKNMLAIGASDSKARLWDLNTRNLTKLEIHIMQVSSVAFSKDGNRLATASYDGSVRLWDTSSSGLDRINKLVNKFPENQNLSFKPTFIGHAGYIHSIAFSPSGDVLVSGSDDGTVKLWDVTEIWQDLNDAEQPGAKLKTHTNAILSLAFTPGRTLVSGSADKTLKLINIGKVMTERRRDRNPKNLESIINQNSSKPDSFSQEVSSVAVSPSGKLLAAGNWDGSVKLWELSQSQDLEKVELPSLQLPNPQERILAVSFSKDESMLAASVVSNEREIVKVWQIASRRPLTISIEGSAVAFSPTNRTLLATGGVDGKIGFWDAETGKRLHLLGESRDRSSGVLSIVFSPDGKLLATGSADSTVTLWNVETRKALVKFERHLNAISSLAFSSRSDRLATGSYDGSIKVWDTREQIWGGPPLELATLKTLNTIISLAFSPDDRTLVAGGADGYLWLWRAAESTKSPASQ